MHFVNTPDTLKGVPPSSGLHQRLRFDMLFDPDDTFAELCRAFGSLGIALPLNRTMLPLAADPAVVKLGTEIRQAAAVKRQRMQQRAAAEQQAALEAQAGAQRIRAAEVQLLNSQTRDTLRNIDYLTGYAPRYRYY